MRKETLAELGWQDGDGIDGIEPKKRQKEMNLVGNPKVELRGRVKAKILPAVHRKIYSYIQIDVHWRRPRIERGMKEGMGGRDEG